MRSSRCSMYRRVRSTFRAARILTHSSLWSLQRHHHHCSSLERCANSWHLHKGCNCTPLDRARRAHDAIRPAGRQGHGLGDANEVATRSRPVLWESWTRTGVKPGPAHSYRLARDMCGQEDVRQCRKGKARLWQVGYGDIDLKLEFHVDRLVEMLLRRKVRREWMSREDMGGRRGISEL